MSAPAPCKVSSCKRDAKLRGFCQRHYQRAKRHGDPTVVRSSPWRRFGEFANRSKTV